ncbi:MAG: FeoB-associated Cys-rich membrane protein [Opitutae bacterium]|nr:FeoB-associated Cys-rich membrane protein [Opitutae bacterium]MBC9890006.1 FeoB-associated Cys-rich membrane protein [Opitutae bacterium]
MIALDSIIVILIVLGALAYLGRRYYKKWKSPKACGMENCGCTKTHSKLLAKEKSPRP